MLSSVPSAAECKWKTAPRKMVPLRLAGDKCGIDGQLLFSQMMEPHLVSVDELMLCLLQVPLGPLQLVQQPAVVPVQLLQHSAPLGHLQVSREPLRARPVQPQSFLAN